MLMIVKTNEATHIAINIPTEATATMLSSLVTLFENNATFIKQGWNELTKVEPDITVELKNKFTSERNDLELVIVSQGASELTQEFSAISPEVMVSIKQTLDRKQKEVERMQRERDDFKRQAQQLKEDLELLQEKEERRKELGL